jgi:hypothetical protein
MKIIIMKSNENTIRTGNQPEANHQVYTDADTWTSFGRLTRMYVMLSNYTKSIVKENAETGVPVMRPLFLHYESDPESYEHPYEFLYGRDLLVAPVLFRAAVSELLVILEPLMDIFIVYASIHLHFRRRGKCTSHPTRQVGFTCGILQRRF